MRRARVHHRRRCRCRCRRRRRARARKSKTCAHPLKSAHRRVSFGMLVERHVRSRRLHTLAAAFLQRAPPCIAPTATINVRCAFCARAADCRPSAIHKFVQTRRSVCMPLVDKSTRRLRDCRQAFRGSIIRRPRGRRSRLTDSSAMPLARARARRRHCKQLIIARASLSTSVCLAMSSAAAAAAVVVAYCWRHREAFL